MCGVCSRGYRDKRELKKHQATHNHLEQDPDSPEAVVTTTTQASTASHITVVSPARTTTVNAVSPAKPVTVAAPAQQANSMATITFSLPTEPVPKNQLGMAPPEPQVFAPLNPAQIQLPPSVATALQNMNQKVKQGGIVLAAAPTTPVKQEQVTQITTGGHVLKQIQGVLEGDGQQLTLAGGSFPGLVAAGGGPQVIYYVMPSTMQPIIQDSGLRASGEGGTTTTQFVALPAGALQATVPVSSVNGSFPQWIIGTYLFFTHLNGYAKVESSTAISPLRTIVVPFLYFKKNKY